MVTIDQVGARWRGAIASAELPLDRRMGGVSLLQCTPLLRVITGCGFRKIKMRCAGVDGWKKME